jgi:phage host-nuclease inhibitor protein Gam
MANPNPRTDQLPKQQPRWKNLPTRAIRVPEILLGDIERYARSLDNGEKIEKAQIEEFLKTASIEELISLKQNLENAIDSLLAEKRDRIELVLKGKRKTLRGLSKPSELAKELLEIL